MLDIILIILLIISLSKPDVLLAKKAKEKATEEQKAILVKNLRKIYAIFVALMESLALSVTFPNETVNTVARIVAVVFVVLFFVFAVPAIKANRKIMKELDAQAAPSADENPENRYTE